MIKTIRFVYVAIVLAVALPGAAHAGSVKCIGGGVDKQFDNVENINVTASPSGNVIITFHTASRIGDAGQRITLAVPSTTFCEVRQ